MTRPTELPSYEELLAGVDDSAVDQLLERARDEIARGLWRRDGEQLVRVDDEL